MRALGEYRLVLSLMLACAMGIMAIALSMNFGLANTIVQEHAPSHLRGRVSAVDRTEAGTPGD